MSGHRGPRARVALLAVCVMALAGACGRRSTGDTAPGATTATTTTMTTSADTTTATTTIATTTTAATTTMTTPAIVTTTLDSVEITATITATWERFFLPTTSIADRMALLENGATLQQALEERAQDPLMQQASATVKNIELTAPGQATVTYDVLLNGTVALADSQGVAVLQDGVWKVSANSFCALISLGATSPIPGCG